MKQKLEKKVFVFHIIAFELGVANCQNFEQDTCRRKSMSSQTPLKFQLTLVETFSKSTSLIMMKTDDKSVILEISQPFGMVSNVDYQRVF